MVDYLLTHPKNLPNIMEFKVGELLPLLSDHCPITATVRMKTNLNIDTGDVPLKLLPDTYMWDDDSSQTFQETLRQEKFKTMVDNLMSKENLHMDDVKELLQSAAKDSKIKMTNNKKKRRRNDPPWFDDECRNLKKEINTEGKKLRSSPDNVEARRWADWLIPSHGAGGLVH